MRSGSTPHPPWRQYLRRRCASVPTPLSYIHSAQAQVLAGRSPTSRSSTGSITTFRGYTEQGMLASFSGSVDEQYQRAAVHIDKILRGARPADIPVEQPTKFELVINLKTAKSLGLTIPQSVLERADEVIQ